MSGRDGMIPPMDELDLRSNLPGIAGTVYWIDGPDLEQSWTYWWKGPMGTYKSVRPRNLGDEIVGQQETQRIIGRVYGAYPDAGPVTYSSMAGPSTQVDVQRELPDVFYERHD